MKKIKLAIAEDHYRFREILSSCLSNDENFEVVFEAENGQELLNKLIGSSIDIVILDIKMPILNGIETLKLLKHLYPAVKVIMFSSITDQPVLIELRQLGANSFACKYDDISILKNAIEEVYENDFSFNEYFRIEYQKG